MKSINGNFLIFMATIFAYTPINEAGSGFVQFHDLTSFVSEVCNDVENLPEKFCDKVVGIADKHIKLACNTAANKICDSPVLYPFRLLTFTPDSCKRQIKDHVCKLDEPLLNWANVECVEEIHKVIVGKGCDENGDEISICDGLPDTADGICTMIVDEACSKLPWILDVLIPVCQVTFSIFVCALLP